MSLIAVGVDPAEGPEVLRAYRDEYGYPWTVARGDQQFLENYGMNATAAKTAVDRRGMIRWKGTHTVEDVQAWEQIFEELARQ